MAPSVRFSLRFYTTPAVQKNFATLRLCGSGCSLFFALLHNSCCSKKSLRLCVFAVPAVLCITLSLPDTPNPLSFIPKLYTYPKNMQISPLI